MIKHLLQQRCRTTQNCIIKPYHRGCGQDSIEKDSQLARRADHSRQRQARLHTVGFDLARFCVVMYYSVSVCFDIM